MAIEGNGERRVSFAVRLEDVQSDQGVDVSVLSPRHGDNGPGADIVSSGSSGSSQSNTSSSSSNKSRSPSSSPERKSPSPTMDFPNNEISATLSQLKADVKQDVEYVRTSSMNMENVEYVRTSSLNMEIAVTDDPCRNPWSMGCFMDNICVTPDPRSGVNATFSPTNAAAKRDGPNGDDDLSSSSIVDDGNQDDANKDSPDSPTLRNNQDDNHEGEGEKEGEEAGFEEDAFLPDAEEAFLPPPGIEEDTFFLPSELRAGGDDDDDAFLPPDMKSDDAYLPPDIKSDDDFLPLRTAEDYEETTEEDAFVPDDQKEGCHLQGGEDFLSAKDDAASPQSKQQKEGSLALGDTTRNAWIDFSYSESAFMEMPEEDGIEENLVEGWQQDGEDKQVTPEQVPTADPIEATEVDQTPVSPAADQKGEDKQVPPEQVPTVDPIEATEIDQTPASPADDSAMQTPLTNQIQGLSETDRETVIEMLSLRDTTGPSEELGQQSDLNNDLGSAERELSGLSILPGLKVLLERSQEEKKRAVSDAVADMEKRLEQANLELNSEREHRLEQERKEEVLRIAGAMRVATAVRTGFAVDRECGEINTLKNSLSHLLKNQKSTIESLQSDLLDKDKEIEKLQNDVASAKKEQKAVQSSLSIAEKALISMKAESKSYKADSKAKIEKLESFLKKMEQAFQLAKEEEEKSREVIQTLKETVANSEQSLVQVHSKLMCSSDQKQTIEVLQLSLSKAESTLQQVADESNAMQQQLLLSVNDLRRENQEMRSLSNHLTNEILLRDGKISDLEDEVQKLNASLQEQKRSDEEITQENTELKERVENQNWAIKNKEEALDSMKREIAYLISAVEEADILKTELGTERVNYENEISFLNEKVKALSNDCESLKSILTSQSAVGNSEDDAEAQAKRASPSDEYDKDNHAQEQSRKQDGVPPSTLFSSSGSGVTEMEDEAIQDKVAISGKDLKGQLETMNIVKQQADAPKNLSFNQKFLSCGCLPGSTTDFKDLDVKYVTNSMAIEIEENSIANSHSGDAERSEVAAAYAHEIRGVYEKQAEDEKPGESGCQNEFKEIASQKHNPTREDQMDKNESGHFEHPGDPKEEVVSQTKDEEAQPESERNQSQVAATNSKDDEDEKFKKGAAAPSDEDEGSESGEYDGDNHEASVPSERGAKMNTNVSRSLAKVMLTGEENAECDQIEAVLHQFSDIESSASTEISTSASNDVTDHAAASMDDGIDEEDTVALSEQLGHYVEKKAMEETKDLNVPNEDIAIAETKDLNEKLSLESLTDELVTTLSSMKERDPSATKKIEDKVGILKVALKTFHSEKEKIMRQAEEEEKRASTDEEPSVSIEEKVEDKLESLSDELVTTLSETKESCPVETKDKVGILKVALRTFQSEKEKILRQAEQEKKKAIDEMRAKLEEEKRQFFAEQQKVKTMEPEPETETVRPSTRANASSKQNAASKNGKPSSKTIKHPATAARKARVPLPVRSSEGVATSYLHAKSKLKPAGRASESKGAVARGSLGAPKVPSKRPSSIRAPSPKNSRLPAPSPKFSTTPRRTSSGIAKPSTSALAAPSPKFNTTPRRTSSGIAKPSTSALGGSSVSAQTNSRPSQVKLSGSLRATQLSQPGLRSKLPKPKSQLKKPAAVAASKRDGKVSEQQVANETLSKATASIATPTLEGSFSSLRKASVAISTLEDSFASLQKRRDHLSTPRGSALSIAVPAQEDSTSRVSASGTAMSAQEESGSGYSSRTDDPLSLDRKEETEVAPSPEKRTSVAELDLLRAEISTSYCADLNDSNDSNDHHPAVVRGDDDRREDNGPSERDSDDALREMSGEKEKVSNTPNNEESISSFSQKIGPPVKPCASSDRSDGEGDSTIADSLLVAASVE